MRARAEDREYHLKPDATARITTSYSGNMTTATDPTGHAKETVTDGLGRMTTVVEDPRVGQLVPGLTRP